MRILLLTNNLWAGGKERRLIELIKGFTSYANIDFHLVIFSDRIHYKEVHKLGVPITILKRVPKQNPLVFYRFYKLCKSLKPDLIHSCSSMSSIWAIPTASVLKIKLINANIADAPSNMNIFDKRLIRAKLTFLFSKVIIGNSFAGLDAYTVSEKKRVCIYNGFDVNRIKRLTKKSVIKKKFQITTEKVIGMTGSFYGNKDYKTYVEAALLTLERRNDVTFLAVGDGTERAKYEKMIPADLAHRFIFTGLQDNVESIVNIFDIGVLSTYTEGISNAILEYMALKKPTVATRCGGTIETVEDGKTGYLISGEKPVLLAEKLNYLLDHDEVRKEMGVFAKQRLEEVFGIKKMIQAYYQLYLGVSNS